MNIPLRYRPLLLCLPVLSCVLAACAVNRETASWRPLFDGKSTAGWRGYNKNSFPQNGWVVENGCLRLLPNGEGGNLITEATFDDFEFQWEWRINERGNNGIKYFVTEKRPESPGHEYQMVDDTTVREPKYRTASFYDVLPPQIPPPAKPPGEWNQSRLLVRGNHVEHWLNGTKVLAYELGSSELKAALAKSKFNGHAGFGEKIKGHIMLTDHHSETWYRNLKIRELPVAN